jgi:membrane protein YdbS with pleckstrin-like domain
MYSGFREWSERILCIPPQPDPPPGDEASTRIFLAAPNYYKYLLAMWALKTGGIVVGAFIFTASPLPRFLEWLLFASAIIAQLFALVLVRLDFDKRWYVITDRSLRIREGIFHVQEMTVTFANIQNISISQGPVQRVLGICDLRVDTAGGGGNAQEHGSQWQKENLHTAWFRGIDNAQEIRTLIQQRLRQHKDAGLGDHDDAAPSPGIEAATSVVAALREVHAESRALNQTLSRLVPER